MSGQSSQDPLEYFHPRNLFRTSSSSSSEEGEAIKSAKEAIDAANPEALSPETYTKYQDQLKELIDTSPNKVMTASYLLKHISEDGFTKTYLDLRDGCVVVKTGGRGRNKRTRETVGEDSNGSQDSKGNKSVGRSTKFSLAVKSGGICQVTGAPSRKLTSSHILPFSSRQADNPKTKQYLALVKALFGPVALQRLLENVLNGDKDGARNINRLDNGIAMMLTPHEMWDAMDFFIEVLWDTYDQSTKEFDAKFHWISSPETSMVNRWKPPFITPDGSTYYPIMSDGDIIPFCRQNPSSSSSSATPSSGSLPPTSAPSPISAPPPTPPPKTPAAESPLPSAHLLYVREIITRIANTMGAAGYAEYGYWDDDDDNESALAPDLEEEEASDSEEEEASDSEEETGKPSKPRQAKEEMLQVAAWLD